MLSFLVLVLVGGMTIAEEGAMNRRRFIQVEVDRCIEEAAQTDEVKHLRGRYFLAQQGNDLAAMGKIAEQLEVIKRTVAANATIKASEQWEVIKQAQGVAMAKPETVKPISLRELHQADQERAIAEGQKDEQLWLLRQQVLIEAEKLRLMQGR